MISIDGTLDSFGNRSIILSFSSESSKVYYISDEYWTDTSQKTEIIIESDDNAVATVYIFLHQLLIHNLAVTLNQRNANTEVTIYIVFMLKGHQKLEIDIEQTHQVGQTSSSVKVRGIVMDYAYNSYQGTISIAPKATDTRAIQEHKTLLLSSHARVVSKPVLQVLNNQVHCKHGAAVGKCDERVLFYMQARGFSLSKARMLCIEAFLQELLKEHENKIFSESITRVLAQMIP